MCVCVWVLPSDGAWGSYWVICSAYLGMGVFAISAGGGSESGDKTNTTCSVLELPLMLQA